MTYEELLELVKGKDLYWFHHRNALLAIVELHSPCQGEEHSNAPELINEPCICVTCFDEAWPCPTIQAIEKELE